MTSSPSSESHSESSSSIPGHALKARRLGVQPSSNRDSNRPSNKGNALARGKACLTCRRRKMRCDGLRPVCTQCKNGRREKDCEFDEGRSKSRTQMLMENVSQLERRLHDLQRNNKSYAREHRPYHATNPQVRFDTVCNILYQPGSSELPTNVKTQPGQSFGKQSLINDPFSMDSSNFMGGNPICDDVFMWPFTSEPQTHNRVDVDPTYAEFFQIFLMHQQQLGVEVFPDGTSGVLTEEMLLLRPLANVVLLWGCKLSNAPSSEQIESQFLEDAISDLSEALVMQNQALEVLHSVCLLATYLYSSGRLLEGKSYADTAMTLALGLELHQSYQTHSKSRGYVADFDIEEDQLKFKAFWNTFELGIWSITTGSQNIFIKAGDIRETVNTAWSFNAFGRSHSKGLIIADLLSDQFPMSQGESTASLRAKSAALLQLSSSIASSITNEPSSSVHWTAFNQVDECISKCSVALGPLPMPPLTPQPIDSRCKAFYDLVVVQTHLSAAMILLHHPMTCYNPSSLDKCQTWARKVLHIVELIPERSFKYLPPTVGICWAIAADVVHHEIIGDRETVGAAPRYHALEGELQSLRRGLERLSEVYGVAGDFAQQF